MKNLHPLHPKKISSCVIKFDTSARACPYDSTSLKYKNNDQDRRYIYY